MDIVTYPDPSIINKLSDHGNLQLNENAKEDYTQNIMRFTISLKGKVINAKKLLQLPIEFPKINDNYISQKYSYLYAIDPRLLSKNNAIRPIYKINVNDGSRLSWQEAGMLPSEPIFVPKPKALNEDEGVVMSIVLDVIKKRTFLLILDGETFQEISRLYTPYCIPLGLHGQFYPE